jgi:glutamate-ammonia-ligase adenylyltransferase
MALSRVRKRLSPTLAEALLPLFSELPDPDSALIFFERLLIESNPEVVRLMERHHFLAHYALVIFGHSRFLGETLIQNTDLLHWLARERKLDQSFSREEFHESLARFRSRSFETDVALLLSRFRRREYVRIMLRDVLKIAPLAETTAEISAIADVLIEEALREADSELQRRYGSPQHLDSGGRLAQTPFAVLSLGKLGGNELNYNSDVDLMYVFGDGAEPKDAPISNREYFVRLAQKVTEILSRVTREGSVFRIDMRLRPQGNEGELAISLSHALRYYAETAHDWELQALIKVRHTAGDQALAREFIRGVQGKVYADGGGAKENHDPSLRSGFRQQAPASLTPAKRLNFAAIETALKSRERMHQHRQLSASERSPHSIDVKMDRGGIRDIEFLVQCLQRVYGGSEPWLRSGGTLFSLQKLHDKGHITGQEFHELTSAYGFLRHLEHRLQLRQGHRTHSLPSSDSELSIVQRAMAALGPGSLISNDLIATLRVRMAAVSEIYRRILHEQKNRRDLNAQGAEFALRIISASSVAEQSNQQLLERLVADAPLLGEIAGRADLSPHARKNFFRFLSASFTSSERYADVLRHASAVEHALKLFETSSYLTDILVRHPEEIATLDRLSEVNARVGSGYLFESPLGRATAVCDPVFAYLANAPTLYGERLSLLRQHYRHRVFAAGARDIASARDVYESMGETTAAAEDAIMAALGIAGEPEGLAVMALGRLGGGEFDVLSDADVLLVGQDGMDRRSLTKAAEQIMHTLSAYTRDGTVFPVDIRLRPHGEEGELVVTLSQLASYFAQEAQAWEALSYTKLRFIAGDRRVGELARSVTEKLFERFAADSSFLPAVREMRSRLETAEGTEKSFKSSAGGIYDIDFISSYLLVQHGIHEKQGSLRDRLWRCVATGFLGKADAAVLDHAAELLRTVEHVVRLVLGRARKWLPASEHPIRSTEKLTARILQRQFSEGLEVELMRTLGTVREVYERVMRHAANAAV